MTLSNAKIVYMEAARNGEKICVMELLYAVMILNILLDVEVTKMIYVQIKCLMRIILSIFYVQKMRKNDLLKSMN